MGGHRDGNVAAYTALAALCGIIRAPADRQTVRGAFSSANDAVASLGLPGEHRPPGTTLLAAVRGTVGGMLVASTGDSRAYLLDADNEFRQITVDHQQECGALTDYIGDPDTTNVRVDITAVPVGHGHRLLLCTDGVFDYASDAVLSMWLSAGFDHMLGTVADISGDNVTAILIDIDRFSAENPSRSQSAPTSAGGDARTSG